jgi:hypothetical protein
LAGKRLPEELESGLIQIVDPAEVRLRKELNEVVEVLVR